MLVIIGPSASGKTQIVEELIKKYQMEKLVTYTTRNKRTGEIDGKDYFFISIEEFQDKIKQNFFIEYVYYNNNYYGTSRSDLGNNKVVILEQSGLKHYLKEARNLINIVYLRTSQEVLRIRMQKRGDSIDNINKRLTSDKIVFSTDIAKLSDMVIDTTPSNIYDDAKSIYQWYNAIKEKKNG